MLQTDVGFQSAVHNRRRHVATSRPLYYFSLPDSHLNPKRLLNVNTLCILKIKNDLLYKMVISDFLIITQLTYTLFQINQLNSFWKYYEYPSNVFLK